MPETEAKFGKIHLLKFGLGEKKYREPELLVPRALVTGEADIEYAKDIAAIQDAPEIPRRIQRHFVNLPIDEIRTLYPHHVVPKPDAQPVTKDEAKPQQEQVIFDSETSELGVTMTESGIILVAGTNTTENDSARVTNRQVQRMDQYWRFTGLADQWEIRLERGELSPDQIRGTAPLLRRFRAISNAWYRDEFEQEPLTREVIKKMNDDRAEAIKDAVVVLPVPHRIKKKVI